MCHRKCIARGAPLHSSLITHGLWTKATGREKRTCTLQGKMKLIPFGCEFHSEDKRPKCLSIVGCRSGKCQTDVICTHCFLRQIKNDRECERESSEIIIHLCAECAELLSARTAQQLFYFIFSISLDVQSSSSFFSV